MRYLVVVETLEGEQPLLEAVRDRAGREAPSFFILIPASPPRGGLTWTESEAALIARDRLDRALERFEELGVQCEGRVGDANSLQAVSDLLRKDTFDEVIIFTPPHRASRWMRSDLPGRVQKDLGLPVTHMTSTSESATRADTLRQVSLLSTVSDRRLRALAKASVIREYRDGKRILKAGTSGSDLYVILDGRVKVQRGGETVARIGAGEMFGEISLLDPGPRTADVVADGPTRCLHLSGRDFKPALRDDPRLVASVLQAVGKRLRDLLEESGGDPTAVIEARSGPALSPAAGLPALPTASTSESATRAGALEQVPLFAALSHRRLRALAKVSVIREYRDGTAIVKAGTSGSDLYVILDGRVKVQRGGGTVARIGAGEMFGEISLLDPGPRTADVIADGPTRCLQLAGRDFKRALEDDPNFGVLVLQAAGKRLRELVRSPVA